MMMMMAWKQIEGTKKEEYMKAKKKEKREGKCCSGTFFMEAFSTSFFTNIAYFGGSETRNQIFNCSN